MYVGGGTCFGSSVMTQTCDNHVLSHILLLYNNRIYFVNISFFYKSHLIHKLYVSLTSYNHHFYPNNLWHAMHHSYRVD